MPYSERFLQFALMGLFEQCVWPECDDGPKITKEHVISLAGGTQSRLCWDGERGSSVMRPPGVSPEFCPAAVDFHVL